MSVNDASNIVIDDSRVTLQIVASLTDNSRGVIYYCNVFIVQATGLTSLAYMSGMSVIGDEEKKFYNIKTRANYPSTGFK